MPSGTVRSGEHAASVHTSGQCWKVLRAISNIIYFVMFNCHIFLTLLIWLESKILNFYFLDISQRIKLIANVLSKINSKNENINKSLFECHAQFFPRRDILHIFAKRTKQYISNKDGNVVLNR